MKQQIKLIASFSSIIVLIFIIGTYNVYQDQTINKISDEIRFELKPVLESLLQMRGSIILLHINTEHSMDILQKMTDNNSSIEPDENLKSKLQEDFQNVILEKEKESKRFEQAFTRYSNLIDTYFLDELIPKQLIKQKYETLILLNTQIMKKNTTEFMSKSFLDFDTASIEFLLELDEITEHELHEIEELEETVDKTLNETSNVTIGLLSGSITLAVIISIISGRSFLKPIQKLLRGAEQVSKGNLDYQIESIGSDEQRQLINSFNKMIKTLKQVKQNEKLTTIGELSARISHDMRNPLAVLQIEFDSIKHNKMLDEKQTRRIHNAIKRISHQIDDVMEFLRETPLQITNFNLTKLVENSLDTIVIPSEVKINISDDEIFMIGDEHKIDVVMINLILNSIQAVENSGTIDITLSQTDTETIIEVKDSGPGITMKPIEQIFDPMETTKQKGTGLGLVSVKNIVIQHGGTISVKNNPTTFTIKIPKKESIV